VSSFWKRAVISAEVATRVAAPITHPALEAAHLEPVMTPAQSSQQIQREQRDAEMQELQWQEDRDRDYAVQQSAISTRHERSATAPPDLEATPSRTHERTSDAPQRRGESASAPSPVRDRDRTR
jgi:hypothetical protein